MNRLRSSPYRELRDRATERAALRVGPSRGVNHLADVLGEVAFAQAFTLDPGIFDLFDAEAPLFWIDGFPIIVAGTLTGESFIAVSRTWTDTQTYLVIATHTPASSAASLSGWVSDYEVQWSRATSGYSHITLGDLFRIDDLRRELERRAAEEYALTQLVERRMLADGKQLEIFWWTDKDSAAIALDGRTIDYIYAQHILGAKVWHRVRDRTNRTFKSWTAARDSAIDDVLLPEGSIQSDPVSFTQRHMSKRFD